METRTDFRVCNLCDALCGVAIQHDGRRVLSVRGDEEDPFSRGHLCPKGAALGDLLEDPDRVVAPLRREGDRWREVPWEEALDEIASRVVALQRAHGRDSVGFYYGNPTAHSLGAIFFGLLFARALGSHNLFSSNSVDSLPRLLVSSLMYGNQAVLPVPDIDRTRLFMVLGANPVVSNGSIMTAPDIDRRLKDLRARGGSLVVLDPRRGETARVADRHHFVRPGTDALLLAAMLRTLFREGLADLGRLAPHVTGWEALPALFEPFAAERVAPAVGLDAAAIAGLAREFARGGPAACHGRVGTCIQEFGALTTWLLDLLHFATGNMDREGGLLFPSPAVDLGAVAKYSGQTGSFGRFRSRVSGLPEFNSELPVAALAEELETPGRGQVRALLTHAGNPVLSLPNGRRLERALGALELLVCVDIYRNETSRLAHFILPPTLGLERDEYPVLFHAVAVRNTAHFSPALLPAPPGVRDDWRIFLDLLGRLEHHRGGLHALGAGLGLPLLKRLGPRGLLDRLLRLGPSGLTLAKLEAMPHGVDLGPLVPRAPAIFHRPGRRADLAPAVLVRDLERLRARLDAPLAEDGALQLISRRSLRSNNSWMHNSHRLVKGRERCTLLVHPDDAAARSLTQGARATVASRVGAIEVPVEVTRDIMPGVVCLPHGFGHHREGASLRVAKEHAGASINDVTDERRFDAVSGASALNGVPVTVTACEGVGKPGGLS
ncbi:MAG: molybdopterin-dependent oxidoreductase [Deltaproteobacteria bacterium]|nr:molybdopterin-dependent oxidoreductase [Deltaproteobacteria bacterium]